MASYSYIIQYAHSYMASNCRFGLTKINSCNYPCNNVVSGSYLAPAAIYLFILFNIGFIARAHAHTCSTQIMQLKVKEI